MEPQAPEQYSSFADALDAQIGKLTAAHKETIPGTEIRQPGSSLNRPTPEPAPAAAAPVEATPEPVPAEAAPDPVIDDPFKALEIPAAPAPEAAKVDEPAAVDPIDAKYSEKPPGKVTEAATKAWGGMRTELKAKTKEADELKAQNAERDAKIAELEAKLTEFSTKQAVPKEEWEKVQKEHRDLNTVVKLTNLEQSPEYKQAILEPLEQVKKGVESLATKHGLDSKKLFAALSEADADTKANALSELMDGMNMLDQSKVVKMSEALEAIDQRKAALRSDVDKSIEQIKQNRTKAQEMSAAQVKQAKEAGVKAARANYEKSLWLLQKREGDDWREWNASIDQTHDVVRRMSEAKMDPDQFGAMLYSATLLPKAIETVRQAHARVQELETALSKYQKVTPGAGSGGAAGGDAPVVSDPNLGFVDSVLGKMKNIR